MKKRSATSGASLIISVLVVAGIALLLGLGRLRAYRYQCFQRLDRQREIQQMLATRSSMRWLETVSKVSDLPTTTNKLEFATMRGAMDVYVCPAPEVFPMEEDPTHYDLLLPERSKPEKDPYNQYVKVSSSSSSGDSVYKCKVEENTQKPQQFQLVLGDANSVSGDVNRITLDISEDMASMLWSKDPYGRRYMTTFNNWCVSGCGDRLVFGITPRCGNLRSSTGEHPYAIWMEQTIVATSDTAGGFTNAYVSLYIRDNGVTKCLGTEIDEEPFSSRGLQIAGTYLSFVRKTRIVNDNERAIQAATTFTSYDLGTAFCSNFVKQCEAEGIRGIRLTAEVDILHERTSEETAVKDTVSRIQVTPAYEYQTILGWTNLDGCYTSEVSTVIRYDPKHHSAGNKSKVENRAVTYDTHGTYINRKNHVNWNQ